MVKISRNNMITRRIRKLRANVEINTQNLQGNAPESLKELFNNAKTSQKTKTSHPNKDKPGRAQPPTSPK